MTNADKIRALPNEVLAEFLHEYCANCYGCEYCKLETFCGEYRTRCDWLKWLESEAEEDADNV